MKVSKEVPESGREVRMDESRQVKMLELEGLEVRYGTFRALKEITLSVDSGAVGLLGPNGAGKSTLIKTLLGLKLPCGGRGALLGRDVERDGIEIRMRVGYAPEHDCHVPGMNGFEYVAYCGRLVGMPAKDARRRAHEVLEYVGLGEARYRPVDGYSTGMRQRAKLAQALVHDPRVVVLDEPTNGFDPKGRDEILALIHDISHRKGVDLLLSTHLLKDVERTCDSVILLNNGAVARYGLIADLKAPSERVFDIEVSGPRERLKAAAEEAGWRCEFEHSRSTGRLAVPRDVEIAQIFAVVRQEGLQLRTLVPAESSLEEFFLATVEE